MTLTLDQIQEKGFMDGQTIDFTPSQALLIGFRALNQGDLYIDVRKWNRQLNVDGPVPTKKGLMLPVERWPEVIKIIQDLIKKHENDNTPH